MHMHICMHVCAGTACLRVSVSACIHTSVHVYCKYIPYVLNSDGLVSSLKFIGPSLLSNFFIQIRAPMQVVNECKVTRTW